MPWCCWQFGHSPGNMQLCASLSGTRGAVAMQLQTAEAANPANPGLHEWLYQSPLLPRCHSLQLCHYVTLSHCHLSGHLCACVRFVSRALHAAQLGMRRKRVRCTAWPMYLLCMCTIVQGQLWLRTMSAPNHQGSAHHMSQAVTSTKPGASYVHRRIAEQSGRITIYKQT
jgi:hypothetical protein